MTLYSIKVKEPTSPDINWHDSKSDPSVSFQYIEHMLADDYILNGKYCYHRTNYVQWLDNGSE